MNQLDHFVLAAADLDAAKQAFAESSGCEPVDGGSHKNLGTRNALASFGDTSYLEIVAPDPNQSLVNNMGGRLAELTEITPLHWAIRVNDLNEVAQRARSIGLTPGKIRDTSRIQPNGERLDWQLMGITDHDLGGLVPFFINWMDCPHPAQNTPPAGHLSQFTITAPAGPLHELLQDTAGVTVQTGNAQIDVRIKTPGGELTYQANTLAGFSL